MQRLAGRVHRGDGRMHGVRGGLWRSVVHNLHCGLIRDGQLPCHLFRLCGGVRFRPWHMQPNHRRLHGVRGGLRHLRLFDVRGGQLLYRQFDGGVFFVYRGVQFWSRYV